MSGPVAPSLSASRDSSRNSSRKRESLAGAFHDEAPPRANLRRLGLDGSWHGAAAEQIELISRGDIVNGILARGAKGREQDGHTRTALLVVAHDAGSSASASDLLPVASWVAAGLSVVVIDLPLHGQRASAKLSERFVASIAKLDRGEALDQNSAVLVEEFFRQATIDLVRTLDAVVALGDFDSKRIGFLGLGLGARLGTTLLAHDDRPCAAVLARAASVAAPPAVDPDSTLALEMGSGAWPADARAFLASRLGF